MFIKLEIVRNDKDKIEQRIDLPVSLNRYSSWAMYVIILGLLSNFAEKDEKPCLNQN